MNRIIAGVSWIAVSVLVASGQTTTEATEFEVASVKRVVLEDGDPLLRMPAFMAQMMGFQGGPGSKDPGRIDYSKVTLKMLLARAYNLRPEQISGPGWLDTERYTVAAKLPPGTDPERLRTMLQKLLTERFQIRLHRDMKEMPVYRLTVAKGGPKLTPAQETPKYENDAEMRAAMQAKARANMAAMSRDHTGPTRSFGLANATMAKFAEMLSNNLDHPVKDMTQVEGTYSFNLRWSPDDGRVRDANDEPSGPSIFAAIQEQLGLKLEAGKESIELLVVDSAEKEPVSN